MPTLPIVAMRVDSMTQSLMIQTADNRVTWHQLTFAKVEEFRRDFTNAELQAYILASGTCIDQWVNVTY